MRTLKTLRPGQKGTKNLLSRYGPDLLCVRYRYDEEWGERLKTVELVVERCPRNREAERHRSRKPGAPVCAAAPRSLALCIGWQERELQKRVKAAGGRWDPGQRVWLLRRDRVERLGLLRRVVHGGS